MKSQLNWKILKQFSGKNIFGFSYQDVVREFPENNPVYLASMLASMVDTGMLFKITRNNYHIIPLNADPETYLPDSLQVAKYLMQNKEYYIGYASAMKIHGITLQSEDREYVVTKKQMKPSISTFGDITIQFIQHHESRFFGFSKIWINQYEEALVSDLEKTIVDMATKPRHSGGIVELGYSLLQSRARTDHDKLFFYFAKNRNKSAKKRFLFLTDLLQFEWTSDHDRMTQEIGSGISLLDPTVPEQGRKRSEFGLRINVDPAQVKEIVLNRRIT